MREQPPGVWHCWLLRKSQEHNVHRQKPVSIATVPAVGTRHFKHLLRIRCHMQGQSCPVAMRPKPCPQLYNTNTAARHVAAEMIRATKELKQAAA